MSTLVISLSPSSRRTARRFFLPWPIVPAANRSVNSRARRGSAPERERTIRHGCFAPRNRTVRRGSSVRNVSAPIRIASTCARKCCAWRREAVLVIHCVSRGGGDSRPSRLIPHLAMTNGRLVSVHLLNASLSAEHSLANTPARTLRPACLSSSIPCPACLGLGSGAPITNRRTPASTIASVQGPVRPVVEQGSSVTYRTALFGTGFLKLRRHSTSACGHPARL